MKLYCKYQFNEYKYVNGKQPFQQVFAIRRGSFYRLDPKRTRDKINFT